MFFNKDNFTSVMTEDEANLVAKMANELIDDNGMVVYGSVTESGEAEFSTEKKESDTHVAIAIGIKEMGIFAPKKQPIRRDSPEEKDLMRALSERNRLLELEIKQLRSRRNEKGN